MSAWKNSRRRESKNVFSGIVQGCQNDKTSKGRMNREQIFADNYKTF